jgi:hypothetical protein
METQKLYEESYLLGCNACVMWWKSTDISEERIASTLGIEV